MYDTWQVKERGIRITKNKIKRQIIRLTAHYNMVNCNFCPLTLL